MAPNTGPQARTAGRPAHVPARSPRRCGRRWRRARVGDVALRRSDGAPSAVAPHLIVEALNEGDPRSGDKGFEVRPRPALHGAGRRRVGGAACERKCGDAEAWIGHSGAQDLAEVLKHLARLIGRKEVGVVDEAEGEPTAPLFGVQVEVELGDRVRLPPGDGRDTGQVPPRHVGVQHVEVDVEERRLRPIAARRELVHQRLEGNVLVGVRSQRDLTHLAEELLEREIGTKADTEDEGIQEVADEPGGLGAGPSGDRRPHHDVVLPRVPAEEELKGGEQRHEGRHALAPTEPLERAALGRFEDETTWVSHVVRLHRRPRVDGGQLHGGGGARRAAASNR